MIARIADITTAIRTLAFAQREDADAWVRGSGLTRQQAFSLGFIEGRQHRGVIARDLAESTRTTPASVASVLKGLEERGLVVRRPSPEDSRVKLLTVTPEGSRLVAGYEERMWADQAQRLSVLSDDEQEQLLTLLRRVTAGVQMPERPRAFPEAARPE
ncbi:MAG: winged helix DNA-binding protein [Bifidobacterium tibiigranuli]|jgi:DNA-binding MarR family transcriptional regulator|nr:winged helix DNA-binding protein [Bifidobacterium tibiigranuli]